MADETDNNIVNLASIKEFLIKIKSFCNNNYSKVSHTHGSITTIGDNRSVNTSPTDYTNKLLFQGIKKNIAIDNPSSDTYSYVIGLRGWGDDSGGYAHELAFNNSGIFTRINKSSTEWDKWTKISESEISGSANYAVLDRQNTFSSNNTFTGDVNIKTATISNELNIPGGKIWIE